jgi:periplasmic protein TonB
LIAAIEHGGEVGRSVARSKEMADDAPNPLPDLGEIRPTRADDAAADTTTVTRVLGHADPAFAPGIPASNRAGFAASGTVAVAAHALALLAVLTITPTRLGGGGDSFDAISVSIISANALESREPNPNLAAGAAPAQVALTEGDSEVVSQAAPDKPEESVKLPNREPTETPSVETEKALAEAPTAPETPAPETVADALAAPTIAAAAPEPPAEPEVAKADLPPEKAVEKSKKKKPEDETSAPSPETAAAGGAPSRGVSLHLPPASAAASASRGDANAYGREVQAALLAVDQREAKARSVAARAKGTVVLRLVIADDGALERADIHRSSGHRQLDEAAVQLVRLTAFPRPPAGLRADQRAYIAPIVFR